MKPITTILLAFTMLLSARAADSGLPAELAEARARYEAEVANATKPIRDRYIQELRQLESHALLVKDADLAAAVDLELESVGVVTQNPERSLERRLANTNWVWFGSETITLLAGGKARWSGNNTDTFTWQVTDGPHRVIEGITANGHKYKMILDPNLQTGNIKETDANNRPTARIRKK